MSDRAQSEDGYGCKFNDLLIEGFGVGGKNGRVGNLEKNMKKLETEVTGIKAVQLKLIVWTSLAAGGSSAAATAIYKLLSS